MMIDTNDCLYLSDGSHMAGPNSSPFRVVYLLEPSEISVVLPVELLKLLSLLSDMINKVPSSDAP